MNLQRHTFSDAAAAAPPVAVRRVPTLAAFTMVEIALSLAIIGFALVAIIGILPAGLNVQKENREQTMMNYDAALIMDTIRSGARGPNTLTNYIISITNVFTLYNADGTIAGPATTNWFRTNQTYVNGTLYTFSVLTNGDNIVRLLSTPKYIATNSASGFAINSRYYSNDITADFRAFSGPAVDLGLSQSAREFAFSYRVAVEIIPTANYPYWVTNRDDNNPGPDWINFTAPGAGLATITDFQGHGNDRRYSENLQQNLNQFRLRFAWPILPSGKPGGGRMVLRSAGSGRMTNQANALNGSPNLRFYYIRPNTYTQSDNSP